MNNEKKGLEFELEMFLSIQEHVRKGKFKEALQELRDIEEQLPPKANQLSERIFIVGLQRSTTTWETTP